LSNILLNASNVIERKVSDTYGGEQSLEIEDNDTTSDLELGLSFAKKLLFDQKDRFPEE